MRILAPAIMLLSVAYGPPGIAQESGTPHPAPTGELSQRLKSHSDEVRKFLDAHSDLAKAHSAQFDALAADAGRIDSSDPNEQMKLQMKMTQIQQQWSVTSQALQSLNEMYRSLAEDTR